MLCISSFGEKYVLFPVKMISPMSDHGAGTQFFYDTLMGTSASRRSFTIGFRCYLMILLVLELVDANEAINTF